MNKLLEPIDALDCLIVWKQDEVKREIKSVATKLIEEEIKSWKEHSKRIDNLGCMDCNGDIFFVEDRIKYLKSLLNNQDDISLINSKEKISKKISTTKDNISQQTHDILNCDYEKQ